MYTQAEYLYGWLLYLLGVAVIMVCGWLWTARLRSGDLRLLLRLGVAVALLVPWPVSPEEDSLAPAWIMAAFEGIFDGGEAFWRAGTPLLSILGLVLGVTLIVQIIRRFIR